MLRRTSAILLVLLLAMPAIGLAIEKTMMRKADTIKIEGKNLDALYGAGPENIGLFAKQNGALVPVPFQIDQRNAKGELTFPHGVKKIADSDPTFDANDELWLMAADCGDKADTGEMPVGATAVVEIELTDPVDRGQGWVYVAAFADSAPRSSVDYVRYDAKANVIYARNYTMGFSTKAPIAIGHLSLTPQGGGNNTNQVDRLKIRFSAETLGGIVAIAKNEDGFTSDVIAYIDGPIRVIRRTKNRQTLFWKIPTPSAILDNIYYANMFEFPTRVDLPFDVDTFLEKPKFVVSTDSLCSIPGRIFLNEKNPNPVQVDGKMSPEEKALNKNAYKWMVVAQTGQYKGGWMNRLVYDKKSTPVIPKLYYVDDISQADPPEEEPGQCGDVGYSLDNLEEVEKGVLRLTSVMYNIPSFDSGKVPTYLNILDHPIQVSATTIK